MAKPSKTIHQTAKNASKLHKLVGEYLTTLFPNYEIRQEYSVNRVNEGYHTGREKFDWVVLGLNIVVEVHGEQHYRPVCFGGITMTEAKRIFEKRVEVDEQKKNAATDAGWAYIIVKYDEKKIDLGTFGDRINESIRNTPAPKEIKPARPKQEIRSQGFRTGIKQKIPGRGFQKPKDGYKWPKRKLNS